MQQASPYTVEPLHVVAVGRSSGLFGIFVGNLGAATISITVVSIRTLSVMVLCSGYLQFCHLLLCAIQ